MHILRIINSTNMGKNVKGEISFQSYLRTIGLTDNPATNAPLLKGKILLLFTRVDSGKIPMGIAPGVFSTYYCLSLIISIAFSLSASLSDVC